MRKGNRACTVRRAPLFWGPVESGRVELARPLGDNDLAFFMPLLQQKRGRGRIVGQVCALIQPRLSPSLSPGIMGYKAAGYSVQFHYKITSLASEFHIKKLN